MEARAKDVPNEFLGIDGQENIFKMQYLGEWIESKCLKCGSSNIQVTEKATGCNDCGWHDA